ncbi:unnamed protein product, partial [Rotaria sordida]
NDEYICKPRVIKPFDESDECNDSIADIPEYINARTKWRKEHGIIYDDISELASSDEQQLEAEDAIVNEISELTELEEERLQTGNKTATKIRALSTTSLSLITKIEVTIAPSSLSSLSVSGCSSSITVIDEHADVIEDEELAIAVVAEKEATMRAKEPMEIALQAAKEAEETYKKVSMLKGKKRTKKTIIAQIDEIYTYETTYVYKPPLTTINRASQTMSMLTDIEIIIDDIVVVIETLNSVVNFSLAVIDTIDAITEVVNLVHA